MRLTAVATIVALMLAPVLFGIQGGAPGAAALVGFIVLSLAIVLRHSGPDAEREDDAARDRRFLALLVLTGVTVGVAYVDLGPFSDPVALAIAVFKASLVVLFFMHVKDSRRMTKITVVAGFLWLAILFGLTLSDYLTRGFLG